MASNRLGNISSEDSVFVDGWRAVQVLGEGSYGEVKLIVNEESDEALAVKIIDVRKCNLGTEDNQKKEIMKEICVHRGLKHKNIIQFFGHREEGCFHYLFMEYASSGELFDKIEPEVGMSMFDAQRYFLQLLGAVEYLHSRGIAHRDIKPENLLLDGHEELKLSDFGFSTVFRHRGRERLMTRSCGTVPYLAPEVYSGASHRAQPADVWSAVIVLVAMLSGELPWDAPHHTDYSYSCWMRGQVTRGPWTRVSSLALSLVRKCLTEVDEGEGGGGGRWGIREILAHTWCQRKLSRKAVKTPSKLQGNRFNTSISDFSSISQPTNNMRLDDSPQVRPRLLATPPPPPAAAAFSYSQPTQLDALLLNSQLYPQNTQLTQHQLHPLARLVKRMTRFLSSKTADETMDTLKRVVTKLGYTYRKMNPGELTITTVDKRSTPLLFKANLRDMSGCILVDFRLSKGDGLEFKKCFIGIRDLMSDCVMTRGVAMATTPAATACHPHTPSRLRSTPGSTLRSTPGSTIRSTPGSTLRSTPGSTSVTPSIKRMRLREK